MRQVRRRLRRSFLVLTSFSSVLAIALGLAAVGAFTFRYLDQKWNLRIAAGPSESAEVHFAEALKPQLRNHIRIDVLKTESPSASAVALDEGRADLAIVRSDVAMPKKGASIVVVHKDAVLLLTYRGSKLSKVPDLEKKRVGIVPGNPANTAVLDTILTHASVPPASVQHIPLQRSDVVAAIEKNLIDAVLVVAPLGDSLADEVFRALATRGKAAPEFIDIEGAEAIARRRPEFEKIDIPSGFFNSRSPRPKEDLATLSVTHHLVARQELAEATVTDLTKRLFGMRPALAADTPLAAYMEAPDTEKGASYPVHPGAAAYYDGNEKSFMDRYGDWIYIAAMVLGAVGSGIAGLVSSVQARSRRAALAVIDQLVEIKRKAHQAVDLGTLKKLSDEVDAASDLALHRARESLFDETGIEALRLAVDEARHAISSRARELESSPLESGTVRVLTPRRPEPSM